MATAQRLPTAANPFTTAGNSAQRRSTHATRPLGGESVRLRLIGGANDPGIEPVMNSARLAGRGATAGIDSGSMTRFGSRSSAGRTCRTAEATITGAISSSPRSHEIAREVGRRTLFASATFQLFDDTNNARPREEIDGPLFVGIPVGA